MAILNEATKITVGQRFNSLADEATRIIDRLSTVKTEIVSIRNTMQTDTDTYDAADVTEANTKLTELQSALDAL